MIEKINKWLPTLTFVILVALVLVGGNKSTSFGGATNYDSIDVTDGYLVDGTTVIDGSGNITIGSSGTELTRFNVGTCYIRPYATTIAATSTAEVDCQGTRAWNASGVSALTGVSFGDIVVANLATSTSGSTGGGLVLNSASASTTAGYISLKIVNLTGTTYTWPTTGTASGTATYFIADL